MASPSALDLWGVGNDTAEIARILKITEAKALEQVSKQRSAKLGLPIPYASVAVDGPAKPAAPPRGKRRLARPLIALRCGV